MPDQNRLATLAARLYDAQARRDTLTAPLDAEIDELKAAIRAEVEATGPDTYAAGDHTITVRANRRFDPQRAAEVLPAEVAATITKTVIDPATAKRALPPAMYQDCMTERGQMVVTVK